MNAKQLLKKANISIYTIEKHGRRASYSFTNKSKITFTLDAGSGWNILKTKDNAICPKGFRIENYHFTPDNLRFGLTDEEVLSILEIN